MNLKNFNNFYFDRWASKYKEIICMITSTIFFESCLPGSYIKVLILRLFGAKVGQGVKLKPRIRIKLQQQTMQMPEIKFLKL